jgi:2,3-bisphosphoglycerate-independent phosphoglycerate mutase
MKAAEITDAVVEAIGSGKYDHIRLNFANGDMVGHTGILESTRIAVEAVDLQIGRLVQATAAAGGVLLITADHGNADEMYLREKAGVSRDPHGHARPRTAHTVSKVPFIVYDPRGEVKLAVTSGGIAQIGATLLSLCGLQPPEDYLPSLVG